MHTNELLEAQTTASRLQESGETPAAILNKLNTLFESFFYVRGREIRMQSDINPHLSTLIIKI